MRNGSEQLSESRYLHTALEAVIRIGLILLLAAWCLEIVKPFIGIIVWGIIIAIAVSPVYERFQASMGGRRRLAATLFTLILMVLLITPSIALVDTVVTGARQLGEQLSEGRITIPPPSERVAGLPIVGQKISEFWTLASENLSEAAERVQPQIRAVSRWLLGAAARAGIGILVFILAIIIAGALLANTAGGQRTAEAIFVRLAGDRGAEYLKLAQTTVRSVARGILGVALIQSMLAGIGFLAIGLPAAGVLAIVTLFLCIIQLGPLLVLLPTVIWMFSVADPLPAVAYLVWSIFVQLIDNVLKPLLLGRGVDVPMLVIFIGAIGGFLSMGIIGLFVGSIVLVLGYTLFVAWLREGRAASSATQAATDGKT